jgi:hypothetical protein
LRDFVADNTAAVNRLQVCEHPQLQQGERDDVVKLRPSVGHHVVNWLESVRVSKVDVWLAAILLETFGMSNQNLS